MTGVTLLIIVVPLVFFCVLGSKRGFPRTITRLLPRRCSTSILTLLGRVGGAVTGCVDKRTLIYLFMKAFAFVKCLLVKLPCTFLLKIATTIAGVVPCLKPCVNLVPTTVVKLAISPTGTLLIYTIILMMRRIRSGVVSPGILNGALSVRPLAVLFLLLTINGVSNILKVVLTVPACTIMGAVIRCIRECIGGEGGGILCGRW